MVPLLSFGCVSKGLITTHSMAWDENRPYLYNRGEERQVSTSQPVHPEF
jgi:hypothetical protein